jgi:hypothetical protein
MWSAVAHYLTLMCCSFSKLYELCSQIKGYENKSKKRNWQAHFRDEAKDVTAIYGKPDRNYKDEEDNVIFAYNPLKIRLTFYKEEDLVKDGSSNLN